MLKSRFYSLEMITPRMMMATPRALRRDTFSLRISTPMTKTQTKLVAVMQGMDQRHLVDHQSGEEKAVGDDHARIQELTEESALFGFRDIGLFLEDDLAERGDKCGHNGGAVAESRGKK